MVIGIGIDYTIHFLSKYRFKVQEGLTDPDYGGHAGNLRQGNLF